MIVCGTQTSHLVFVSVSATPKKLELKVVTQTCHVEELASESCFYGVNYLSYDESTYSLCSGVSRVGVFKWLFYVKQTGHCMEPNLIKVFPIT